MTVTDQKMLNKNIIHRWFEDIVSADKDGSKDECVRIWRSKIIKWINSKKQKKWNKQKQKKHEMWIQQYVFTHSNRWGHMYGAPRDTKYNTKIAQWVTIPTHIIALCLGFSPNDVGSTFHCAIAIKINLL